MIRSEYVGHVTQQYWKTFCGKIWEKDQNYIPFIYNIFTLICLPKEFTDIAKLTVDVGMLTLVYFCQKSIYM